MGQTLGPLIESISAGGENTQHFSFEPQITARESSPGFDELNSEIEQARLQSIALNERRNNIKEKIAKKERKKEKKKRKSQANGHINSESDYSSNTGMSEVEANNAEVNGATTNGDGAIPSEMLPSEKVLEDEAKEKREEEERKRQRDPPVIFNNIDVSTHISFCVFFTSNITRSL